LGGDLIAGVQLDFLFDTGPERQNPGERLRVDNRWLSLHFVRNARARRYVMRLDRHGDVRVTVPRGGTIREARKLAQDNVSWLASQWRKHHQQRALNESWSHGTEVLLRGILLPLVVTERESVREIELAGHSVVTGWEHAVKPAVEGLLWDLAKGELPPRVRELGRQHAFNFTRVTIRNQRSRWGSCSPRGTISLNWRLVQMPPEVCDYIILHELAHTRHLNHSVRFWREVKRICPGYREAEHWIRQNGERLLPAG